MESPRKLLVVSVAGLGAALVREHGADAALAAFGLPVARTPLRPPFPAVTCTAQATFRTATAPALHGMVANGGYDRRWRKTYFWEQSAALVEGPRIWTAFRAAGRRVGLLFWQQAMGEAVDVVVTPAPIHRHHGGTILDCYSQPAGLYPRLRAKLGEFPLRRYWGPCASAGVGDWIVAATAEVMRTEAPELLLTYLPTLDYDLQRHGPGDRRAVAALRRLVGQLGALAAAAASAGYALLFWGDYAVDACAGAAVLPNLALRTAGLFAVRQVRGRTYPDWHTSRAFAMCDHEAAHVYVRDGADLAATRTCLAALAAVASVQPREAVCGHPNAGEWVLTAAPGRWFGYPWWTDAAEAPDYARHVDIHSKPGFDPCELLWSWRPPGIALNSARIRGTHGRADRPVAWGGNLPLTPPEETLASLAATVRAWLEAQSRGGRWSS